MIRSIIVKIIVLGSLTLAFGQTRPVTLKAEDENSKIEFVGCFCPSTKPVLFGKPYIVPALPIFLTKLHTHELLVGAKVRVLYVWQWLEYPYPEHSNGAWSESHEIVDGASNKNGVVRFPEYKLIPRGWNKIPPKNLTNLFIEGEPRFDHLEVRVSGLGVYDYSFSLSKKEVDKISSRKGAEIFVNLAEIKTPITDASHTIKYKEH